MTRPLGTKEQNPCVIVPGPQPRSTMMESGLRCGIKNEAEFSTVRDKCEATTLALWPWAYLCLDGGTVLVVVIVISVLSGR